MRSPFQFASDWKHRLIDAPIDAKMRLSLETAVGIAQNDWVPVMSGYLRSTIGYTYDQSRKLGIIHADAPYAAIIEEGSIYQRAQPYLRPALNAVGRIWGGSMQISYPNAYKLSGGAASPEIAKFNRETSERLHKKASGRAKVRYQHTNHAKQSRTRFRMTLNHPSPNDATTPIL